MASGRFISTSIAEDTKLGKLSITAELLYLKTIPHLDRDGMISGRAGLLWGRICPLRDDLIGEMQKCIDEWIAVGLVIRMDSDEGPVLFFPGFLKNNNLLHYDRERPSRFPVPPGYVRTEDGLLPEGAEPKKKKPKKPKPDTDLSPQVDTSIQDVVQESVQEFSLQEEEEVKDQDQVEVKAEEAAPPAVAAANPDAARVWDKWNANMPGVKTPVIVDSVNSLMDDYSAAEIEEAITIACTRNIRSLSYVQGILAKGVFKEKPKPLGGDYPPPRHTSNRGRNAATRYMERKGMLDGRA